MPGKPFLIWISGVLKTLIGLASAFPPLIMKCTVKCKVAVPIRKRSLHIAKSLPPKPGGSVTGTQRRVYPGLREGAGPLHVVHPGEGFTEVREGSRTG